jgi:hypothetical protein
MLFVHGAISPSICLIFIPVLYLIDNSFSVNNPLNDVNVNQSGQYWAYSVVQIVNPENGLY